MKKWFNVLKSTNSPRTFMVTPKIWSESGLNYDSGFFTIEELEERLGRKLETNDFMLSSPLTWKYALDNPTMMDRIGKDGLLAGINVWVKSPSFFGEHNSAEKDIEDMNKYGGYIQEILKRIGVNSNSILDGYYSEAKKIISIKS